MYLFSGPGFTASFPLSASHNNSVFVFTVHVVSDVSTFSRDLCLVQMQFIRSKIGNVTDSATELVRDKSLISGDVLENLGRIVILTYDYDLAFLNFHCLLVAVSVHRD